MIRILRIVLITLILLVPAFPAVCSDELSEEFWTELEPFTQPDAGKPSREDLARGVLEEARFVFSGLIYGFSFTYTPSDPVRKVAEVFELVPVAQIPAGDPSLTVKSTRTENGKLFVRCTYRLKDFQLFRLESYRSSTLPKAGGSGKAGRFETGARLSAVRDAMKNAVREHVRQVEYNRPKEIRGEVYLLDAPSLVLDGGVYAASVRVRLMLREIVPYRVF